MSPVINFTGNMALSFGKDKFLSNDTNKQNIINLIGKILQIAGYNVVFSQEDADVDIVLAAIKESHYQNVTVVGEDTDLLILLLYYYSKQSDFQLLFHSDKHAKTKDDIKHNINFYSNMLGLIYVEHYYFCIVLLVAIQSQTKSTSFKLFPNNPRLLQLASIFQSSDDQSSDDIKKCHRGNCNDDFGMLRKQKKITPSKSFVEPNHLPPTKHSLKYHSYRAYFQILKWLNIPGIKAEDWG